VDLVRLNYSALQGAIEFQAATPLYAYVRFPEPIGETASIFLRNFEQFQIIGTQQGDFLQGSSGNDTFIGLGGNDTLNGGGGRDTLRGGDGDDYITGNVDQGSVLSGGAGNDTLNVWRLDDTVAGGTGFDRLQFDFWDRPTRAVVDLVNGVPGWSGIEAVSGTLSHLNDSFRTTTLTGNDRRIAGHRPAGL